jgi:hypothetical protein
MVVGSLTTDERAVYLPAIGNTLWEDQSMSLAPLSQPWTRPDSERADHLVVEARREIHPGHELEGVEISSCIAVCTGCDEAIFACSDGSFAAIHLTWQPTERPPWPSSTRAGSFIAIEMVMDQHEH